MRRSAFIFLLAILFSTPTLAQQKSPATAKKGMRSKQSAEKQAAKPAPDKDDKKDDDKPKDPMSAPTFSGLKLRLVGPAIISGRVLGFAVNPKNSAEYYVATASGGVWKTINAGATWNPVFDGEGSYSVGAIAMDPKDTNIVWVGTGEHNAQRSVAYGDGVYKTEDGGKTWKNAGLKKSEHIGRIAIDPRDGKTVFIAAQGPLWGPGGDRGLYKTKDGGQTWKKVLDISENTGATEVVIDPDDADTVYAATWQRRRHVWTLISGGPESAIYKSTDAGETWSKLKNGLPTVDVGRIGLAISPADSNVIYATIEAADGKSGIYRSSDRGANWERRSNSVAQGMYYGQIIADPKNVDRIYLLNVFNQVSDDGGKTLRRLGEKSKHVDNHALWVDPQDPKHMLSGNDGGVYESWDAAANWRWQNNLPLGQFYDVTVDDALPFYNVYGGTQDNSSWGGPSRTKSMSGIINSDWFFTHGGDGFRTQVDPKDHNIIYATLQYGNLVRFDRRSGESVGIQPQEAKAEGPLRWNWDSPLLISPHSNTRLYFAANKLYRSDDRGDAWRAISGDLSRQIDRNKLPIMGKVWSADAVGKNESTSFYGNLTSLSESSKKEGLLYLGTDDGLVQVTEDGGQHWTKYEKFAGVPDNTFLSRIAASHHDANTVYAAFDNHKNADFKPYLVKSTDTGKTWKSIAGNLPENGAVLAFAEDPVNPNLLFAGTEFGLWFTIDGGKKWVQLKGGFPTISVHDLAIQARESDLVVGTFGRGIYILDDYTPLRLLKPEMLQQESVVLPMKDALMYIQTRPIGGRGKGFQGETFYTAENPPYGAVFTYYFKDKYKTKKELRQQAEKEAEKKGQPLRYPTNDELRAEAEEEAPAVFLVIYDSAGKPVRQITAKNEKGFQRLAWDLRYSLPVLPRETAEGDEDIFFQRVDSPLVMPGKYSARLFKRVGGVTTLLGEPQNFNVVTEGAAGMKPEERAALRDFQEKVARLYGAVSGAVRTGEELQGRMKAIRRAIQEAPGVSEKLFVETDQIEQKLNLIMRSLRGDQALARRNEPVPPAINDRVMNIMSGERFALAHPTKTHWDDYAIASEEFKQELARLQALVNLDLENLEKQMEAAGAPWTPGRVPEWTEQ